MQTEYLKISGLSNEASVRTVIESLKGIPGVHGVSVSYASQRAAVQFDENTTSTQELAAALKKAGFPVNTSAEAAGSSCCGGCCH